MGFFDREVGDVANEIKHKTKKIKVRVKAMSRKNDDDESVLSWRKIFCVLIIVAIVLMIAIPFYNVFVLTMEGKAQLKKAEQDRQIMVQEAQATFDSSALLADAAVVKAEGEAKAVIARAKGEAQAKIENAKGEAEANQIITASIDFDYNIYLWIKALNNGRNSVVYVATENGVPLPVTEAGKRLNAESPEQIPTVKVKENK
jgi:hypothetical protein